MACQGCGRTSDTRLCCPTCIELGRTTYFCNQECFAANWQSHNQVHKLLRQQAASSSVRGRSQRVPPMDPLPQSTNGLPKAQMDDLTGARGRRGQTPPPLPGGQSLVSHFAQGRRGSAPRKADAVPNGGDAPPQGVGQVLERFVKQAVSLVAGEQAQGSSNSRAIGSSGAVGQPSTSPTRTRRFAKTGFGALGILVIVGGGINHFVLHQYAADSIDDPVGASDTSIALPRGKLFLEPPTPGPTSAVADVGSAHAGAGSGIGGEESLQAEVATLRERLDRHEQMLQYVLRLVETRSASSGASGAVAAAAAAPMAPGGFEAKIAHLENLTAASGDVVSSIGRASEDAVRKRRRSEDAGLGQAGLGALDLGGPVQEVGRVSLEGGSESSSGKTVAGTTGR